MDSILITINILNLWEPKRYQHMNKNMTNILEMCNTY